jgi:mono/diheme cytochrome c family protein
VTLLGCDSGKDTKSGDAADAKAETKTETKDEPAPADTGDTPEASADDGADAETGAGAETGAEPEAAEPGAEEDGGEVEAGGGDEGGDARGENKGGDTKGSGKSTDAKGGDAKGGDAKGGKVDLAKGKPIFGKKCDNCHGAKGNADTKIGKKHEIPDWTKPGWKGKWSQAKIEKVVTNGIADTKMKAFKGKLSAEEIKAVSAYAMSLGR